MKPKLYCQACIDLFGELTELVETQAINEFFPSYKCPKHGYGIGPSRRDLIRQIEYMRREAHRLEENADKYQELLVENNLWRPSS